MSALYQATIVTGIAVGGIYALIAVGITQIYKVTRVLNFAHAGFVMWAAYLYSIFTFSAHLPTLFAAFCTLVCVCALGVLSEMLVFRFAERASTANKIILTFGLLQLLTALAIWIFGPDPRGATPLVGTKGIAMFGTVVGENQIADIAVAFGVVAAVGLFLKYTRLGLLTRATAEDASMAELLGANRRLVGSFNWALAAASAGLGGIFITALGPFTNDLFFTYFIFSVLATMLGGLQSLVGTAIGGLILGLAENLFGVSGFTFGNLVIFGAIVALALGRRDWLSEISLVRWSGGLLSRDEARSWAISGAFGVVFVGAAIALVYATFLNLVWSQTVALILIYAVAALSLIPVLGWTGQVSLATGGLMGIGGFATASGVSYYHLPLPIAILMGCAISTGYGLAVGVIVHRLSFVLSVIVTLEFTNIAPMFMGGQYAPWTHFGLAGVQLYLPSYLNTAARLVGGFVVLGAVSVFVLSMLRNSSWGTKFLATKTAPIMAAHFGVRQSFARIYAYGVSGFIAGIAGSMYVMFLTNVNAGEFSSSFSLTILLYAVAGGVTALWGPFLGSILFIGLPAVLGANRFGSSPVPGLLTGVVVIVLMATSLDGLVALARRPSNALPRGALARRLVARFVPPPIDVSAAWLEVSRSRQRPGDGRSAELTSAPIVSP